MCAQFTLNITDSQLHSLYDISLPFIITQFNELVLPHKKSIVVTKEFDHKIAELMNFSLIPSWSKEPRVKFATHNARIESLTEKPTWRGPLAQKHCLIPMSQFIEPIYENKFAGNMVRFFNKDQDILTAAGLYDEWINKTTGEIIKSFTIITTTPSQFIAEIGHDRSPLFLQKTDFNTWLEIKNKQPKEMIDFLISTKTIPDLEAEVFRPLKPGWEKRA